MHLTVEHQAVGTVDLRQAGRDDRGRAEWCVDGPQPRRRATRRRRPSTRSRRDGGAPATAGRRRGARGRIAQPFEERAVRVARRDDDRSGDLDPVAQRDAAHRVAVAQDRVDGAADAQGPAVLLERARDRRRHHPAPADRSTDARDVAHRVGQRAEAAARELGADAPHHRPAHRGGARQGVVAEERPQHVGRTAPAPPQDRRDTGQPVAHRLAGQRADARRLATPRRGSTSRRASPRGGTGGTRRPHRDVCRAANRASDRRRGTASTTVPPRPRHVVLGGFDVEVLQPERRQVELRHHRCRAEREVVAVADVDGDAGERLAGCRPADVAGAPRAAPCASHALAR